MDLTENLYRYVANAVLGTTQIVYNGIEMDLGKPFERITMLEEAIDRMQAELPAITKFTIPGGHRALSLCHVCRTVCRRAERAALRVADVAEVDTSATIYLNRLSDYLYTLGRVVTERLKVEEKLWIP